MAEDNSKGLSTDESDARTAKSWYSSLFPDKTEPEVPKTAIVSAERDDDEYYMNHKTRGKALIFNHKIFTVDQLSTRNGTDEDCENLTKTLCRLDFQVEVYNDLSYSKLNNVISDVVQEDHSDADCLVIAVFSHGVPNKLYASDASYSRDELWDPFTAERCPTLAGKPKVFLIQACQGDKLDGGSVLQPKMTGMTMVDSAPQRNNAYKIPNRADFLMAFSTYPGYYSWRNCTKGSWFIQSLCEVLNKEGNHKSFMTLMTIVSRKVAIEFESYVPFSEMDEQKQVVFVTTTLIREIYFRPKNFSKCIGTICIKQRKDPTTLSPKDKLGVMTPRRSSRSQRDSENETYSKCVTDSCIAQRGESELNPPHIEQEETKESINYSSNNYKN